MHTLSMQIFKILYKSKKVPTLIFFKLFFFLLYSQFRWCIVVKCNGGMVKKEKNRLSSVHAVDLETKCLLAAPEKFAREECKRRTACYLI